MCRQREKWNEPWDTCIQVYTFSLSLCSLLLLPSFFLSSFLSFLFPFLVLPFPLWARFSYFLEMETEFRFIYREFWSQYGPTHQCISNARKFSLQICFFIYCRVSSLFVAGIIQYFLATDFYSKFDSFEIRIKS